MLQEYKVDNMPDIKIDITQIVKDYFIPLMIGLFVGLLSRALFFDIWLWPIIIAIGSFLLVELLIWASKSISRTLSLQRHRIAREEEERRQSEADAMLAMSFFNSLNDVDKELAMQIYDYPQCQSSSKYERFINPNSEVGHMFSYRLSSFSRNSDSNIMPYIALANYEDCTFKGALQHIIIQPIFYSILEDYKEKNK